MTSGHGKLRDPVKSHEIIQRIKGVARLRGLRTIPCSLHRDAIEREAGEAEAVNAT